MAAEGVTGRARRADTAMTDQKPITPGKAAARLGVDRRTINNWCRDGKLKAFRTPGGHWRIDEAEIERLRRGK